MSDIINNEVKNNFSIPLFWILRRQMLALIGCYIPLQHLRIHLHQFLRSQHQDIHWPNPKNTKKYLVVNSLIFLLNNLLK